MGVMELYHAVPESVVGGFLYPLNTLKKRSPNQYALHAAKYDWRKEVMERRIPVLNCLWNDVIHLTPISPLQIQAALKKAGYRGPFPTKWFVIEAEMLPKGKTVLFLDLHRDFSREDFLPYTPHNLEQHTHFPEKTLAYFRRMVAQGKAPLRFAGLPHVLYKGNLSIKKMRVVTLSELRKRTRGTRILVKKRAKRPVNSRVRRRRRVR